MCLLIAVFYKLYKPNDVLLKSKRGFTDYNQLSLKRTPLGPALAVRKNRNDRSDRCDCDRCDHRNQALVGYRRRHHTKPFQKCTLH